MPELFGENTGDDNKQVNDSQLPANVNEDMKTALENAAKFIPAATNAVSATNARLSVFQNPIKDDTEDEKAEAALVKARATFSDLKTFRLKLTAPLDSIKLRLMEYEKSISIDPGASSEYNRVKGMRNTYANEKLARQEKERKELEAKKNKANEKARIIQAIKGNIGIQVTNTLNDVDNSIMNWVKGITLENYDSKLNELNPKPILKSEKWASWYQVPYDSSLITVEEYKEIIDNISSSPEYDYETISSDYVTRAQKIVDSYKAKLPGIRTELQQIEIAAKEDQERAAQLKKEKEEREAKEQKERKDENDRLLQEQQQKAEDEANNSTMENEFEQQVQLSEQAGTTGGTTKHYATLTCANKDMVKVIAEMLLQIMQHPKFKGLQKTDKGVPKFEILPDGKTKRPVYEKWIETLLSFYADNCAHNVEGISITKCYATTQRGKKK